VLLHLAHKDASINLLADRYRERLIGSLPTA
jgi:hypothetical protein